MTELSYIDKFMANIDNYVDLNKELIITSAPKYIYVKSRLLDKCIMLFEIMSEKLTGIDLPNEKTLHDIHGIFYNKYLCPISIRFHVSQYILLHVQNDKINIKDEDGKVIIDKYKKINELDIKYLIHVPITLDSDYKKKLRYFKKYCNQFEQLIDMATELIIFVNESAKLE